MPLHEIDHLLILLIAVIFPVYSIIFWFRRDRPKLKAREPGFLMRFYRNNIIELWLVTIIILGWWFYNERSLIDIGLGVPDIIGFGIGLVILIAAVIFLSNQTKAVRSSAEARKVVVDQLTGDTPLIIPRTEAERRLSVIVSLTAGICEEIIYRAFFMWYLMFWIPALGAVAVSAIVFGAAHIYQGNTGAVKAFVAGIVFGLLYMFTGTIWIPIALHATIDITGLLTGSYALTLDEPEKESGDSD